MHEYLMFAAKRYLVLLLAGLATIILLGRNFFEFDYYIPIHPHLPPDRSLLPEALPPLYSQLHHDLLQLPQHHWEQDEPGPDERFFYVAGHSRGTSWSDAMEELLLNAYLAYKSGRSFVFSNYTWRDDGTLYSEHRGKNIPSQIPYSAFIRGPIVGDQFPAGVSSPQAVSWDYFRKVCPTPSTMSREDVQDQNFSPHNAKTITDVWVSELGGAENSCVQSARSSGPLYDIPVFKDYEGMYGIWPELSTSPIITHFGWSPLVELAFDMNRDLFFSGSHLEPYLSSVPFTTNADRYPQIPGLLVIHIPRRDREQSCEKISASSGSDRYAFVTFPGMPDSSSPPQDGFLHMQKNNALANCYPSIGQILTKVRQVHKTEAGKGLKKIYIITDGDPEFVLELKMALLQRGEWQQVSSSRDLVLNWEQKPVAEAVDMLIGQRAQVLIGNGYSSMSSNMVMMRMANNFTHESNRLW